MKRLLLPLALIAFAIICLSIVHIDNVNKLDIQSNELRKKHQLEPEITSTVNVVPVEGAEIK